MCAMIRNVERATKYQSTKVPRITVYWSMAHEYQGLEYAECATKD